MQKECDLCLHEKSVSWYLIHNYDFGWSGKQHLFVCLGPYLWRMKFPRLGFKLELQLLTFTSAMATPDLSCVCDLHHSSQQRWTLTYWARTGTELVSSWILVCFFVTAEPQRELQEFLFFKYKLNLLEWLDLFRLTLLTPNIKTEYEGIVDFNWMLWSISHFLLRIHAHFLWLSVS